jgi:hypothetical protein
MSETNKNKKWLEFGFNGWFIGLIISFVLLIGIYLYMHIHPPFRDRADFEYAILDKSQQQQISHIYLGRPDSTIVPVKDSAASLSMAGSPNNKKGTVYVTVNGPDLKPVDSLTHNRAMMYLWNEFQKLDTVQVKDIRNYLAGSSRQEAVHFLSHKRLKLKSYFWLVGPQVYYEIMFWTIFGVIASLIFRMGNVYRNSTSDPSNPSTIYDPTDVPAHIAKIVYAPVCTLVVILGYNYFQSDTMVDIESSKGVVVFSFFAGFYSQRVMAFMDRIKDVILPNSSNSDLPTVNNALTKNVNINLKAGDEKLEREIKNVGFGKATVTLENINTKAVYKAVSSMPGPVTQFKAINLPLGVYTLQADWQEQVGTNSYKLSDTKSVTLHKPDETIEMCLV